LSDCGIDVSTQDWISLSQLPQPRTKEVVQDLFYPEWNNDQDLKNMESANQQRQRASGLFTSMDDDQYFDTYDFITSEESLNFINIHSLLKTVKREGRVVLLVMSHVGQWLNQKPKIIGDRENNKPALRYDFLPALSQQHGSQAEKQSIRLEEDIMIFIRNRFYDLTSVICEPYLHQFPNEEGAEYRLRFTHQVWRDLLLLVLSVTGPNLQGSAVAIFNSKDIRTIAAEPTCSITQAMCGVVPRLAEVIKNPALVHTEALKDLNNAIYPIVMAWAIRQCEQALQPESLVDTQDWSVTMIELVRAEREKYVSLAAAITNTDETVENITESPTLQNTLDLEPRSPSEMSIFIPDDSPTDLQLPPLRYTEPDKVQITVSKPYCPRTRLPNEPLSNIVSIISKGSASKIQPEKKGSGLLNLLENQRKVFQQPLNNTGPRIKYNKKASWRNSPAARRSSQQD
jgi:hypothetical protein